MASLLEVMEYLAKTGKTHVYCDECWGTMPTNSEGEDQIIKTGLCPRCFKKHS